MKASESSYPPHGFSVAWRRSFGSCPPLGHVLRRDHSKIWTRFHALPLSKRYAECAEELQTIVERANTLSTGCFGKQASLWIVAGYGPEVALTQDDLPHRLSMPKAMVWMDIDEEPDEHVEWAFYAARLEWTPSCIDWLFEEIAEGAVRALLFSEDAQTVLAPYDGGFDVLSWQEGKIAELEEAHGEWMSSRSDKL